MEYYTRKFPVVRFVFVLLLFFVLQIISGCHNSTGRVFWSPYSDVNWSLAGHYDAEFHTHPGLGDEQYDPHQAVDRYHAEGYKILTLAGHDYDIPNDHIQSIYPWTKLSQIYDIIKDVENPTEDNRTYGEMAGWVPYEDRDPVQLGMISVEGCEVSGPHHMVSLFSSMTKGRSTEEETLQEIQDLGGLVYFAHPGRYVERNGLTEEWYAGFYRKYDALLGQSVFNGVDRYPADRNFYDKVVHVLGAQRPVWLFGEDDMHEETTLGWNRNVILLENFEPGSIHPDIPDGSAPNVKEALKKGWFYLWKPADQYNKRTFNLNYVNVSKTKVRLDFDRKDLVREIRWITYDPETRESSAVHTGDMISVKKIPVTGRFVRAEIEGEGGTIYTQPFYLIDLK